MGLVVLWHVEALQTRDQTLVSCVGRWILNHFAQAVLHVGATFLLMFKVYLINGFFSLLTTSKVPVFSKIISWTWTFTAISSPLQPPRGSGSFHHIISLSLLGFILSLNIQHVMSLIFKK